jgi:TPR repeat protein
VICPKCGENNSDNFRFCGMCGTPLQARVEARRPAGAPVPNLPSTIPQEITNAPESLRPVADTAARTPDKPIPPISGPSMLGLDQAGSNQPSMLSLQDRSYSGLDSFFEPEQPKTGARRILLLVALLAALGGAGWWTYTNYLSATGTRNPQTEASSGSDTPSDKLAEPRSAAPAASAAPKTDAGSSQAVVPSAAAPAGPSENASAGPAPARHTVDAETKPVAKPQPVTPKSVTPKIALGDKSAEKGARRQTPSNTSSKTSQPVMAAAADTGDADFRKGWAYLYGRGMPENCSEAVKSLKAASAKSNAKARSAFGTMYATGHCVPRDLPTSYLWFAMALKKDPNNQILEKDLSAVWNQMTPPERQMATRMKQ